MRAKVFILGIGITLFFSLFYLLQNLFNIGLFEQFELKTFDLRYSIRSMLFQKQNPNFEVVIVGIDENSLNKLGRWPWNRKRHAELLGVLKNAGAKTVTFDVSFSESAKPAELREFKNNISKLILEGYNSKEISEETAMKFGEELQKLDLSEDIIFAKAIQESGNVLIGTYNILNKNEAELTPEVIENDIYLKHRFVFDPQQLMAEGGFAANNYYKMVPPIKLFSKFAAGTAPYEVGTPDIDGVFRDIPMINEEKYSSVYFPSLYFLTYLVSRGYTMEKNVYFDMKNLKVDIYEDAASKSGFVKSIRFDYKGLQYLNFYGKSRTFKYYPFIDVINGKTALKIFKDKIVLVGYTETAKGLYDLRATPFDPNFPGVEIHATAIQNLIDGNNIIKIGLIFQVIIFMILLAAVSVVFSLKKIPFIISHWIVLGIAAGYLLMAEALFLYNIYIDVFYHLFALVAVYLVLMAANFFMEEREKHKIKKAFQHYSAPALIEELVKHPEMLKLGGEQKTLTVMFTDIAGFTSISEKMKPEELVEFLNEYLSEMSGIIMNAGGTIDKYIGDAIMAIFGAPLYLEDHAYRACKAALLYQRRLLELQEKWRLEGKENTISARIGVNTGDMVVGNMGSMSRFDYTVMGDNVNLASRLEGANKYYGTLILISEATYEGVKGKIIARRVDNLAVKGKALPVWTYEIIDTDENKDKIDMNWLDTYNSAMDSYIAGDFEKALAEFSKAYELNGRDSVSAVYMERSREYIKNPPESDWDGVYKLKTK